jgi:chromosome segregation ATPase
VALAAYAEAWISGAKVVVFGDASSPLAERLIERGARHVQIYDPDAARAAEATAASTLKQVAYAPLDMAGSTLRDGVFDVGIVEDLAIAGPNPKDLLGPLSRALSRRGLALIGSRNPEVSERLIQPTIELAEPLGYYDFYEAVSTSFEEVRMLGQTPFVGYAIADFSASDASDVRLDTALLPGGAEEPEWFLALASALPIAPDAFSVIQLPLADLELGTPAGRADSGASERADRAEAKVNELVEELARLAADRTKDAERHASERARDAERFAAERTRDAERHAGERSRDAAERSRDGEKHAADRARDTEKRELERQLTQKVQRLEAELGKRDEWARGLESRAATADQRADDAQAELEQLTAAHRKTKAELEHTAADHRKAKAELEHLAADHRKARAELEHLTADHRKAKAELEHLAADHRKAKAELEHTAADHRKAKAELEHTAAEHRKTKAELTRLGPDLEEERRTRQNLEDTARRHAQELERRVQSEVQRAAELSSKRDALAARVEQLTAALTTSEKNLAATEKKAKQLVESGDEETRAELLGLEEMLKDRAAEVGRLTAALHETERFGRQLIVELAELKANRDAPPADGPDLQALSRRNAELAADLEAARWTISTLEANVVLDPTAPLDPRSSAAAAPVGSSGSAGQRRDELLPAEPHTLPGVD